MSEARQTEMTPPADAHPDDTPEIKQARFAVDQLAQIRGTLEVSGITPPEALLQQEFAANQKLLDLLGGPVPEEKPPAPAVPTPVGTSHEQMKEILGVLDRAQVRIPSLIGLSEGPPRPSSDAGVRVPELDRMQAEAEVVQHLTAAGMAFAKLAPSQEALEEFNRRALLLIAAKPSENGHPVVSQQVHIEQRIKEEVARKRVFLAIPHTGHVELSTAMATFCHSTTDPRFGIHVTDQSSSLLAYGFNMKFADCISSPQPFDYFCLLHSDIYPHMEKPDQNWVATLIDELEAGGYDAIHAVTAIKDPRGLTSTAIGRIDDEWAKVRRITIDEEIELPETWDMELLRKHLPRFDEGPLKGHRLCLLPNTGVLMLKLGPWVDRFPGFTIRDRLIKYFPATKLVVPNDVSCNASRSEYCYRAQVVPEDWGFGRWCAQNGLRVGCTRKVRTDHYGRTAFPNHQKWGMQKIDEYFLNGDIP